MRKIYIYFILGIFACFNAFGFASSGDDTKGQSSSMLTAYEIWQHKISQSQKEFLPFNCNAFLNDLAQASVSELCSVQNVTKNFLTGTSKCASLFCVNVVGRTSETERVCQLIIMRSLPYVDAVPVETAMSVVTYLSYNLDAKGNALTAKSIHEYRNLFVETRLKIWKRIYDSIDPNYKPIRVVWPVTPPGKYSSIWPPVKPEDIKEPDLRKQYEDEIAKAHENAMQNNQQADAKKLEKRWLRIIKRDIPAMYKRFNVSKDDLEILSAYLRIYVSDEILRKDLYDSVCKISETKDVIKNKKAVTKDEKSDNKPEKNHIVIPASDK